MTGPDSEAPASVRSAPRAPDTVSLDQPIESGGLHAVRASVAAHASELGASEQQVDHLMVIASELATNVIVHGGGSGRLLLWRATDRLFCQVSDQGPGMADPRSAGVQTPAVSSPRGRGIWLARQWSAAVDIVTGPKGTTVTVTIHLTG